MNAIAQIADIVLIGTWIIAGCLVGLMAGQMGKHPAQWALLSWVLSPLLMGFILCFSMPRDHATTTTKQPTPNQRRDVPTKANRYPDAWSNRPSEATN